MTQDTYQLLAMFVRYWFVFLMVMITFRAFRWLYQERKEYRKKLKVLPDAGLIGELVDLRTGETYPLPREGYISGRRLADVPLKGYRHQRIAFEFEAGKGIAITPLRRGHRPSLDGDTLRGTAYALHGSVLDLGDRTLRFRLFAGLNIPVREMDGQDTDGFMQEKALAPEMWAMDPSLWPENRMQYDILTGQMPETGAGGATMDDAAPLTGYAMVPPEMGGPIQPQGRGEDAYGSAQEKYRR